MTRDIQELLRRVRARWRRLTLLRAVVRVSLEVAIDLAFALLATRWTGRSPAALVLVGLAALVVAVVSIVRGFWPLRVAPSDRRIARFIEEAHPSLDDRLVSAVDVTSSTRRDVPPLLADAMVADAARRASSVDPASVVTPERMRRAGFQATAALALIGVVVFGGRDTMRRFVDAVSLSLFPSRVRLDVTPGNARIQAGSGLTIEARLVGNRAPVVAELLRADESGGENWRATEMPGDSSGGFRIGLDAVGASFKYRVRAGTVVSPIFDVAVARPPRVTRIDLDYTFPQGLQLPPRTEEDSGDIYAPVGTNVRVRVHTDREVNEGQMTLGHGTAIQLASLGKNEYAASLSVAQDDSYRVALSDFGGLKNAGDTEYFIRTLEDLPPEVHVVKPARDRSVTRLEEVDVEATAEDDFGIASMDLVYSVSGGPEKVVPLNIPSHLAAVTGKQTLFLEDLDVAPGDFVSYYVRARDLTRGKRPSEARSDIFFLDVKPFDQEFTLATSQGAGGASGNRQLDDLVQAQKDVIVATWKLDRRAQLAKGAPSADDVRAVGKAESELKMRVEQASSAFRESVMRDPRRRTPPVPGRGQPNLRAGQTLAEEDDMTAAAMSMEKAANALGEVNTSGAMAPEMDALTHLQKAQADVKQRQVQQQQAGNGNAANRSNVDMSNLFDRELKRQQQTNYETNTSAEQHQETSMLDKVRDLARRQDELNQRQQDLARKRPDLSAEELKRELEKLTRDQSDLRQRTEELAQQLSQQQSGQQQGQQNQQSGSTSSSQSQSSQSSQGRGGQQGQSGQMRAASEAMRNAANDLRQQNPGQASERGAQASQQLHSLEQQLQNKGPDERSRALGEMRLEARQLADAQRQIASELNKAGQGPAGQDTLRRLAGEEERLAGRAARVQENLRQQAASAGQPSSDGDRADSQQAVAGASRDFDQQRVADRMKQTAEDMRAAAAQPDETGSDGKQNALKAAASTEAELARNLDQLADKLGNASGSKDADSQKLADTRARAAELRAEIDKLASELQKAAQEAGHADPNAQSGPSGSSDGRGTAADLARMRQEYARQLQQAQKLLDDLRRQDPSLAQGGVGITFEGQGMTLSAPGTEAFKQDFAKWDSMRVQATQALERAETAISRQLQARETRDRLASGVDDQPPAAYETQVNSYFKALADRKKQ